MKYPEYVAKIISRFEANGESAFIVGGSLRDMLLGIEPHDYDVATSALPQKTLELFSDKRVIETGIKHGTVTVIWDGAPVEITTFRVDGGYTDSRHPDSVSFTSDITADLSRRDFTVNAMAYNQSVGLVDAFGGREDIKNGLIRAVGEPSRRFGEDALRIMRAFRFAAQLGFEIEEKTLVGARECAEGLVNIARERIASELLRLITSLYPKRSLELMRDNGILPYLFGDYEPSERVIGGIEDMTRSEAARLGFVLSEAKTQTAKEIISSLRLSNKLATGALAVARGAVFKVTNAEDARRLIANTGVYAEDAARASEILGVSPRGAVEITARQKNTPCSVRDLQINGKDLAALGFSGKSIGETLNALLERVIITPEINQKEALLDIAKERL